MSKFQRTADFWNSRQASAPQTTQGGTGSRSQIEIDAQQRGQEGERQLSSGIGSYSSSQNTPESKIDYNQVQDKSENVFQTINNNRVDKGLFFIPGGFFQNNNQDTSETAMNKFYDLLKNLMVGCVPFIIVFSVILILRIFISSGAPVGNFSLHKSAFSLTNIFKLMIFISSFICIFMILFFSIILNRYIQGLIFICGILSTLLINYFFKKIFSDYQDKSLASLYCNILPAPFTVSNSYGIKSAPSTNITLLSFICTYIFYSFFENKNNYDFNYFIIIFLLIIFIIVAITEYFEGCSSKLSLLLAIIIGVIYGFIYKSFVKSLDTGNIGAGDLFNLSNNNLLCKSDKVSKAYKDPNENTKYFKCVKKSRRFDFHHTDVSMRDLDFIGSNRPYPFSSPASVPDNYTKWRGKINVHYKQPAGNNYKNDQYGLSVTIYGITEHRQPDGTYRYLLKEKITMKKVIPIIDESSEEASNSLQEIIFTNIMGYSLYGIYFDLPESEKNNPDGVGGVKDNVLINEFTIVPQEIVQLSVNPPHNNIQNALTQPSSDDNPSLTRLGFTENNDKNRLYIIKPSLKQIHRNSQINVEFSLINN
jgi:hypothetical protein